MNAIPSNAAVQALLDALGADIVAIGDALPARRYADWSGAPGATPLALIRPRTTEQVAQALRICNEFGQPVVPQGGLTGLAGSACCAHDEVAISLERMNRIEEIDAVSATMTVQAGATLQSVQEAAAGAGFMFALDLGARGTCTIGGNLGTNAGGNRVIRYGPMRDQLLGVEAVLANGSILTGLHKMVKNNTGYDLRHLFAGSEGTLGVVTRAVLKLRSQPQALSTALCGLASFEAVTQLLHHGQQQLAGGISAFEVMWPSYLDYMLSHVKGLRTPLGGRHGLYVLLENAGTDAERHGAAFDEFLGRMHEAKVIEDAAIARSHADARALWALRDATAELPLLLPGMTSFDVSFAIGDIGRAAEACRAMLHARWPGCIALFYGHLGDGNLHLIVQAADGKPEVMRQIDAAVYDLVRRFDGSVSAEHGIGTIKQSVLPFSRTPAELAAMRAIKNALDPRDILNRGKVFAQP